MIAFWEIGSSASGTCPMCMSFAGKLWNTADIPNPPLHPNCQCQLVYSDLYDPADAETELPDLSPQAIAAFINLTVYYLTTQTTLPAILQPFVEEAMKRITNQSETIQIPLRFEAAADLNEPLRAVLCAAGKTRRMDGSPALMGVTAEALKDAYDRGLFSGLNCFIDHADGWEGPSVRDLLGTWSEPWYENGRVTATLDAIETDHTRPTLDLIRQTRTKPNKPDLGVSIVFWIDTRKDGDVTRFRHIESADVVVYPAVPAARFLQAEGVTMPELLTTPAGAANAAAQPDPAWNAEYRRVQSAAIIDATSDLPALVKTRLKAATYQTPDDLNAAIDAARAELAALHQEGVINLPGRPRIQMRDPMDEAREITEFLFGAAGVNVPANMRRVDEWYRALTGDYEFRGTFDPDRVQFAGATTTTLANLAVNAMNKVIVEQMANLTAWRWYEWVTDVAANDGSLHAMQWITVGGIGNLPTVAEGASYTELVVDDAKESSSFTKYGGYVGITREVLKNSDIARLQAIPRALANAAVRSRSAAVSAIFTANAGVGPTLAQDSTALFEASSHKNLLTTALGTDATAWRAARAECFQHTELNSAKPLGIFPRYLLVPAELYDVALSILGYGEGMPTTYTPEAQGRGFADPRAIPIVVPDWTDATDWAYIVDPAVFPVIQMSYSQSPGGRSHPAPELFAVTSATSGLLFTNDTLPIKVRDEFAVGVNGPRGIGKRNVA